MSAAFPAFTLPAKGEDETVAPIFDFTNFPEVGAGGTLSSPSVPAVAGLTIGTPAVTAADDPVGGVDEGKGVVVSISGGTAGTDYTVACFATITDPVSGNSSVREVRATVPVR